MAYQIKYAYTCHIGKIRNNNEDNFWCCGEFLNAQNQGMSHIQSGCRKQSELPVMAVFDGMGGESCGEMAAFLAAESCGMHYKEQKDLIGREGEQFLLEACEKMNQAVCDYGTENRIDSMGTTAAMLAFGEDMIYGCNLGDSRIYFMDGGKLQQISTDHVFGGTAVGKAPLTQYLGLPEELQRLEPSVTEIEHKEGYRYLLCSDGVTDMLSDSEIEAILSQDMEIPEIVNDLLKNALQKGGRDNVTIVLCEVQKLDTVRRMKEWMKNLKDKK